MSINKLELIIYDIYIFCFNLGLAQLFFGALGVISRAAFILAKVLRTSCWVRQSGGGKFDAKWYFDFEYYLLPSACYKKLYSQKLRIKIDIHVTIGRTLEVQMPLLIILISNLKVTLSWLLLFSQGLSSYYWRFDQYFFPLCYNRLIAFGLICPLRR